MEVISRRCSELLVKYQIIPEQEQDIYIYGFELLFTTLLSTVSILILSALLNQLLAGMIFIGVFFTMRMFAGGYHAETHWGCFLITNGAYLAYTALAWALERIHNAYCILMLCAALWYLWTHAPVTHPNQPLTEKKYRNNKKNIRFSIIAVVIMTALLYLLNLRGAAAFVEAAVAMVCLMMIIKPKRRAKYVEVT